MRLRGTGATRGDVVARDGTQLLASPDEALCGVGGPSIILASSCSRPRARTEVSKASVAERDKSEYPAHEQKQRSKSNAIRSQNIFTICHASVNNLSF